MDPNALPNGQQPAPADLSSAPGENQQCAAIPDHELLQCVGRGSYGTVWLARNMMGAYRAVKIVYRKSFDSQRPFERELSGIRKFEPISRSHEGFVDVLHVGINEEEGYFYYVMELGDDQTSGQTVDPKEYSPKTLAREISLREKLTLPECLQLGLALSDALSELHGHGLVHRDVKPSNIIFVNGVPKLADIGLVADANEARSYVGTEGFIPPEGPGTAQADIYSLGKVLYEASTGKDRQDFPELPTQLDLLSDPEGFLELNEVILHACKNDIAKRYHFAWDMHSDLLVLANGKSVKRLKLLERRLASLKRIAGISALVLIVLSAIFYQVYREWRSINEARQQRVGANVAYGNRAMETGDLLVALPYFADALRLDERDLNRETTHRLRLGSVFTQCPKLTYTWFGGADILDGEFSPDGKRILITENRSEARIYDLQTGEMYARPFGQGQSLTSASYSPDGRFLVTGSQKNSACVWDATDLMEVRCLSHPDQVLDARFSPDGLRIVTSCRDGVARVWEAQTGRLELELKQHISQVSFANFSHDGRLIVTASLDNTAQVWDAASGHPVGPPLHHASWVNHAAFSPDDQKVVTAGWDRVARVWEVATGRQILPDLRHQDGVQTAEFSPDGRLILTASADGTARLWLADTLQPLALNPVLKPGVRVIRASFSPEGHRIITTGTDGSVRVWDLAGSTQPPAYIPNIFSPDASRSFTSTNHGLQIWNGTSGEMIGPAITASPLFEKAGFSRNGRFLLVTSAIQTNLPGSPRQLQVLDAANGEPLGPGICVSNALAGALVSDDGKHLVTFGGNVAQAWAVLTGTASAPPLVHEKPVGSAFFSPAGDRVVTRSGNEVQVWDTASGHALFSPFRHPQPARFAEFSPDGSLLVTCCSDSLFTKCFAQVWNTATGLPAGPQLKHGDGVLCAAFSPDGNRVVTASEDFTAIVWDAHTGRQLAPALRHENQVQTATFSPDGKWVVTASSDKAARVWSAETGDPLTPPLRHAQPLSSARFLADGHGIVASDARGHTWIWKLSVERKPVEDLGELADLLSGGMVNPLDGLTTARSESPKVSWERLKTKYPADFTTSAEEVAAWHRFQAEMGEMDGQWFAAVFHLERLLSIQPGDEALLKRLARAEEHLKSGN